MKIIPGLRRRHYLARVGIFLVTAALIIGMVGCDGGGGDYNPPPSQNLEIRTWYDLAAVRNNLAGNHTLMNDLDSTTLGYEELASPTANGGKGWEPIGILGGITSFTGTFDGQGHEIRDIFINRPNESLVGLFGIVAGHIENIGVVNVTVTGDHEVGGLVGYFDGTAVSNSYSTGNVIGKGYCVGGLVGDISGGIVSNSYSTCNVTGYSYVGGLVGEGAWATVRNSYSTGSVTGTAEWPDIEHVGGLVGLNFAVLTVKNSFWDKQTSGRIYSDGGTGKNTMEMQDITTFSGAGWNITAVALNETNSAYIWNIVNNVTYPFLSWQSVKIRDWYDLDAIRNDLDGSYALMNNLNSTTPGYTELASPTANGGKGWQPIGVWNFTTFTGTFNGKGYEVRDLFINRPKEYEVGLFGCVGEGGGGFIRNVGVVDADITGYHGVGALVGINLGGNISDSYSSANVTGNLSVGGLVGVNSHNGTVSNSYSTGSVNGTSLVGGLVGYNHGTVSNSYSIGSVAGNSSVGGLVGYTDYYGTVSYSFWDIQTSGQATSSGGTGKNTADMQKIITFSGAGWDIIGVVNPSTRNTTYIWNIVNNVTYPFLSWQP